MAATASLDVVPRTMRSGQLKSSTAPPAVKKTGCETMTAFSPASCSFCSSAAPVPTGTGVTIERIGGFCAAREIRSARSARCCGLSSARKITPALRAKDSTSVEYAKRPDRTLRRITSARFFSWNGTLPWAISTMRELSGWQQVTGVPKSARQAEITVPKYPAPYTPICIAPPAAKKSAQNKLPHSFIYAVNCNLGRVREGHVPREKVQVTVRCYRSSGGNKGSTNGFSSLGEGRRRAFIWDVIEVYCSAHSRDRGILGQPAKRIGWIRRVEYFSFNPRPVTDSHPTGYRVGWR